MNDSLLTKVERLAEALLQHGWLAGTAESCTGGLVSATLTELAGSSNWFSHGVVSYSNEAKQLLLGVPKRLIEQNGAVSEPVAIAMVQGILRQSADIGVGITGIAGPGGGTVEKPVGTVWIGYGSADGVEAERFVFAGSRGEVRDQAVERAVELLLQLAER